MEKGVNYNKDTRKGVGACNINFAVEYKVCLRKSHFPCSFFLFSLSNTREKSASGKTKTHRERIRRKKEGGEGVIFYPPSQPSKKLNSLCVCI